MERIFGPEIPLNFSKEGEEDIMSMTPLEAGEKLDSLIRKYRYDHPEVSYQVALKRVLDMYPKLKELYGRTQVTMPPDATGFAADFDLSTASRAAIRRELDKRVRAYMEEHGEQDYVKALGKVLAMFPKLKAAYARS